MQSVQAIRVQLYKLQLYRVRLYSVSDVSSLAVAVVSASIMLIVVGAVVYLLLRNTGGQAERPLVSVEEGPLQGEWVDINIPGANEMRYAAFRGVPYAEPPLGELRYKAPRTSKNWTTLRDAAVEGPACIQPRMAQSKEGDGQSTSGSEDCLYLNVYSPSLPQKGGQLLPVYFFIHGGMFMKGSATNSSFGPEFFILQNIVVVTFNYRVGPFGFFNLDDKNVPGNAGLKDQIAALKWVHQNIKHFGGDPDQITVGGQSSGAVCAYWLALLPESKGLMKRVIVESNLLFTSGYHEENFGVAHELSKQLPGGPFSIEELSQLLMELPAETIIEASSRMTEEWISKYAAVRRPYAVTPERRSMNDADEAPLITQDPEKMVLTDPKGVPMLMGMNNREALLKFYEYGLAMSTAVIDERISNFSIIPPSIVPYMDTVRFLNLSDPDSYNWDRLRYEIQSEVKQYFFTSYTPDCDKICTSKQYLDDVSYNIDNNRLADFRAHARNSETFVYRFGVKAAYNPVALPDGEKGAVHADELGYLWRSDKYQQKLEGDGLASNTLRRMTNMWGTFIKTGRPTPLENYSGSWVPTEQRKSSIIFLEIGEDLQVKEEDIGGKNMPFWFKLYDKYRV